MRPEKAHSNRRFRSATIVRIREIQSGEKGLYFRHRLKCLAHGTRTGMNSSTSPWSARNRASSGLTNRPMCAFGKLRRRFLRKGTRMARSPNFQYWNTATLEIGRASCRERMYVTEGEVREA